MSFLNKGSLSIDVMQDSIFKLLALKIFLFGVCPCPYSGHLVYCEALTRADIAKLNFSERGFGPRSEGYIVLGYFESNVVRFRSETPIHLYFGLNLAKLT